MHVSFYERCTLRFADYIKFVAVEGQIPGRPVKPDPSVIFSILSEHPTEKRNTIYVGDSGVDMETARRACLESVGVSWGFRPVSELKKYYADNIIDAPYELLAIVDKEM